VDVLNRYRVPHNRTVTPYEAFTGTKPTFKTVHPFYDLAIAALSKEERAGRTKLYPKAETMRYLGRAPQYKDAYLLYNPRDRSIKVRHDFVWLPRKSTATATMDDSAHKPEPQLPKTLKSALQGSDRIRWIEAIQKEIDGLKTRGAFEIVTDTMGKKPLKSKIVLTIKNDRRFKARWVACDYLQIYGRDFIATYIPIIQVNIDTSPCRSFRGLGNLFN
jgi:hypothetical protein